ncbi:MAG: hypothetical protein PCFJNLEI_01618 [Verrucomicrobiae bacterium]|nr:hypothetical protein [Verrucomicrobiae bacterium]
MKLLEAQRGKNLSASFPWVDFVIANVDILSALSDSPLRAVRIEEGKFAAKIFGVSLDMEVIQHENTGASGKIRILSDIRLPCGLGKTHTIAKYTCFAIDENTTSIDLNLTFELTTFAMRLYACWRRDDIDKYLNTVCQNLEKAAQRLTSSAGQIVSALEDGQRTRVAEFRRRLARGAFRSPLRELRTQGVLRVVTTPDAMVIAAEAQMPDQHIVAAQETVKFGEDSYAGLLAGTRKLAAINNRALAARGEMTGPVENLPFRQAAFEFGNAFYTRVCSGQLINVVPIVVSHGQSAVLRLTVDGRAEELPWEAMHDGQEFLALKVRFSRCVTSIRDTEIPASVWEAPGILLVGSDSKGDLPGVEMEVENIGRILQNAGLSNIEVLTGPDANRAKFIQALKSRAFNILHFSGHSMFDAEHPWQSFLELDENTRFYLHEFGTLGQSGTKGGPMNLVFLNSCQSARVGQDRVTGRQLSMCKAWREAGVNHVVGMHWNVEDDAAVQVGSTFYQSLITNPQLGPEEAMRQTRGKVATDRAWADGSWLAPVLYT